MNKLTVIMLPRDKYWYDYVEMYVERYPEDFDTIKDVPLTIPRGNRIV